MLEDGKTLKQYCKEAKKRLKSGFWQNYQKNLTEKMENAERDGVSTSKVKEYYTERITENLKNYGKERETFYKKVKKIS